MRRKKGKVQTPGSRLRANVLDVLQQEGYIRGYSTTEYGNGRTEFEIELKYFDNGPVIREIERVSKPGRRVYSRGRRHAACRQRPRHHDRLDPEGRHGRSCGSRGPCRRRSPLHGLLIEPRGSENIMSRVGKETRSRPVRRHGQGRRSDGVGQGREGRAQVHGARGRPGQAGRWRDQGRPALNETKRAQAMWGTARRMVANLVDRRHGKGFEKKLEITGVGYKAAVSGKNLQLSLGYSHDIDVRDPAWHRDRDAAADGSGNHRASTSARSGRSRPRSGRIPSARAL